MHFRKSLSIGLLGILAGLSISCQKSKERILFSSDRNGNSDVFIMNSDGSDLRALTSSNLEEWGPVWIDRNTISFLRQEGEKIDRIRYSLLTEEMQFIPQPDICRLDDKNAQYRGGTELYSCKNDIFLLEPDATQTINLTAGLTGSSAYPSWAGDEEIVITNNRNGTNDIYLLNVSDLSLKELVIWDSNDERGTISPDGNFLAFSSDKEEKGNQDILLLNLSSGKYENISNSPGFDLIVRWSRDGRKLYYGGNGSGNWEIYIYDMKTKETDNLTNHPGFDGDPRVY